MSLNYHLCSNKYICLFILKFVKNFLCSMFTGCGISVHPKHPCCRKFFFNYLFHLFSSQTKSTNVRRTALRTSLWHFFFITAIVTDKPVRFMKGQRYITMRAFYSLSTAPAGNKACITPSIYK